MPALPKPHRIAFLVPDVKVEGPEGAYQREAAVLLWTACIETCQRHPRLAVLDAEATPLFPRDGHFAPEHAGQGGRATDAFYGPTRRDEVLWLELALGPKLGVVRLHTVARDGTQETLDALGPKLGEQIQQVLGAWLTARGLGPLPRRFEPVTGDDVLAVLRVIAPTLGEQARAWSLPVATKPTWSLSVVEDDEPDADDDAGGDAGDDALASEPDEIDRAFDQAIESTIDSTLDLEPASIPAAEAGREPRRSLTRPLVNRLPQAFRLPALRLLELALREDLGDAILAVDPAHPQSLFARFEAAEPDRRDVELLRRVIASAPGWARPYETLHEEKEPHRRDPAAPTHLEAVAAAGVASMCRPSALHVLETIGDQLADEGRIDEALRLVERGVLLNDSDPRAHLALLDLHERTGRVGARLEQALRSSSLHGCPMDPVFPWYPDQIHIDLRAASALLEVGRLDEAIALRANRLEGRDATWPHHTRILATWRRDPRLVAWSYAREGYFRGDEARAVEGFGRVQPDGDVDVAILLDSLVALGREDEVPLAWAQLGPGRGRTGAIARLAAARGLMAAGDWRRGLEELWRVELTEPGRDEHVAIARCGVLLAAAPIEIAEAALGERIAIGATSLARRMARDIADFVPTAARSGLVGRALGRQGDKNHSLDFDPAWLAGFGEIKSRRAIDALFAELGPVRKGPPAGSFDLADEHARGDRLVNRWLEVAFADASEDDHAALAQAAAYIAAQALGRYLAATTAAPSTISGALRTVAAGAFALVRKHHRALGGRDARAVLGALDPLLRRVDRWLGTWWLGTVERSLGIDERSAGDVAGFARETPTVAARILGPEETTVLSWSVARLHRERPDGWAAKVVAQASRLAAHTGRDGADEWADAIVAQLAARELDQDDAIDALHTACYLAEGVSAVPAVHAARVLLDAGRAPAALAVLSSGLSAATADERDRALASLSASWTRSRIDVSIERASAAAAASEALQAGDPVRAEKLGRWAIAVDPANTEVHRDLGLALATQGKAADALVHLVKATPAQATQLLADALRQNGKEPEARHVLAYATRWAVPEETTEHAPAPQAPVAREPVFAMLEAGAHATAAELLRDPSWRVRRAALHAIRFRSSSENQIAVTPRARAAALAALADTVGAMDREALLVRALALHVCEQAYYARDPVPCMGDRMTSETFYEQLRSRGGVVPGVEAPAPSPFVDREVVPGGKISRASDYVALLRDLAALPPNEAIAQFDLDEASYLEVGKAWAAALVADPSLAATIATGLAKR